VLLQVLGCFNDINANISELEKAHTAQHLQRHADASVRVTGQQLDAAFQVFLCFTLGFGVHRNVCIAIKYLLKAANGGLVKAQAIAHRWISSFPLDSAVSTTLPSATILLEWTCNAAYLGSHTALRDLRNTQGSDGLSLYSETLKRRNHEMSGVGQPFSCDLPGQDIFDLDHPIMLRKQVKDSGMHPNELILNSAEETIFHSASTQGKIKAVSILLDEFNANPNVVDEDGTTPLLCACRAGHLDVAQRLLERGADPTLANCHGETPLHWVISFDDSEVEDIIRILVRHGAEVSACTIQTTDYSDHDLQWHPIGTPLHWAVEGDYFTAVKALLDVGADPLLAPIEIRDEYVHQGGTVTALERAARNGAAALMSLILSRVSMQNIMDFGIERLHEIVLVAIRGENLYTRRVRHGQDLYNASIEVIRLLVETVGNLGDDSKRPRPFERMLNQAISTTERFGNTMLVEWLLDNQLGNPNALNDGVTPLQLSITNDDHKLFELLLSKGADPQALYSSNDEEGNISLLHFLARCPQKGINGHRDSAWFAQRLLAEGVEVDCKTSKGLTALAYSLINFDLPLITVLLQSHASIRSIDSHGFTVLGVLIREKAVLGIKFLVEQYEIPAHEILVVHPQDGSTALDLAAEVFRQDHLVHEEGSLETLVMKALSAKFQSRDAETAGLAD
jgi:ankyrin repeat protein